MKKMKDIRGLSVSAIHEIEIEVISTISGVEMVEINSTFNP